MIKSDMKKEVKIWLEKAEQDIDVAEYNLEGNMLDAAAFFAIRQRNLKRSERR
jgi:HEPN domain-containing protein